MFDQTMIDRAELVIKQATLRLMKHPETCLYSGVMMMGDTLIVPKPLPFTARTDGFNSEFGVGFLIGLTLEEVTGLRLHETLHVVLKHIPRHRDLWKEDAHLANASMDHVVNNIIMDLKGYGEWIKLPKGGHCDRRFRGWSVREVYDYLKTGNSVKPDSPLPRGKPERGQTNDMPPRRTLNIGGEEFSLDALDEHIPFEGDSEDIKKLIEDVNEALQQGAMLAGRVGSKVPREIAESMAPEVDWNRELADFYSEFSRGADEPTWRTLNRRRIVDDIIAPSVECETLDELLFCIDTSGSISQDALNASGAALVSLCEAVPPRRVRVLWWDTAVRAEQVFTDDYSGLLRLLKPSGGGGTKISCISDYVIKNDISANCMVVLTDGFVEGGIQWKTTIPSLWLITHNKSLNVPSGVRKVNFN